MKISIIIPVYNCKDYIENCVDSIITQTYQNIEIILVNDGSTDESLKKIKELRNKDSRIIIIDKKNGGPSSARNAGLNKATGEYIFFIDSDDFLDKTALETIVNASTKEKTNDILIGLNHCQVDGEKKICSKYSYSSYNKHDFIEGIFNNELGGFVWGYLFNKSLIKELRFDEETCYLEDTLFLVNYLDKIKTIRFVDNVYYNYNISNSSITRSEDKVKRNILNFCDSLDKINVFLNNKYIDLINNKKIKLIKCELYKLKSSSDLEKIIKSEEFKLIISNLSKQKKIFYTNKIYIDLLSLKKYKIIYNINWCRKKLSHIKKKVLKLFS